MELHLIILLLLVLTIVFFIIIVGHYSIKVFCNYKMPNALLLVPMESINDKLNYYKLAICIMQIVDKNLSATINNNKGNRQSNLGNRKRKQFPLLKTGNKSFIGGLKFHTTSKSFTTKNNVFAILPFKTNLQHVTNLKNLESYYSLS